MLEDSSAKIARHTDVERAALAGNKVGGVDSLVHGEEA